MQQSDLYNAKEKVVQHDGLTDMVMQSDLNAVHLVKNLDHVDPGSRVSGLFERSFGDVRNDDYGYDDNWDGAIDFSVVWVD